VLTGLFAEPRRATAFDSADRPAFLDLVWSPDGETLAFVQVVGSEKPALVMVNRENTVKATLAADLNWAGMPLDFSPEGDRVIYAVNNPEGADGGGADPVRQRIDVYRIEPADDAQPELLGSFTIAGGWGGGSTFPTEARYYEETGFLGNRPVLSLTPFGLAHSINCLGEGVAVLNPETGEDAVLDEAIRRAQVSPDRRRVLGIRDGELVVLDLETVERTAIPSSDEPDQVAWGAAGSGFVFYSTRVEQPEPLDLAADEAEALAATGLLPADAPLPRYGVSIHRVDLDTGDDLEVYAHDAWAVGRMIAAPDGRALLFSQIPNLDVWATALADGTLAPADAAASFAWLPVRFYRLDLEQISIDQLSPDLRPAALNHAAYAPPE